MLLIINVFIKLAAVSKKGTGFICDKIIFYIDGKTTCQELKGEKR